MNILTPLTQAQHNAAVNARCAEDLDWEELAGIAGEAATTLSFLAGDWRTRHVYRDHTTSEPHSKLIRLACAMRELVKAIDAEESGE